MSPGIDKEQINRGMLCFFLHILAATGKTLPRQLVAQVDHPSIGIIRTDADVQAIQAGLVANPQALWFQFLKSPEGQVLRTPEVKD